MEQKLNGTVSSARSSSSVVSAAALLSPAFFPLLRKKRKRKADWLQNSTKYKDRLQTPSVGLKRKRDTQKTADSSNGWINIWHVAGRLAAEIKLSLNSSAVQLLQGAPISTVVVLSQKQQQFSDCFFFFFFFFACIL